MCPTSPTTSSPALTPASFTADAREALASEWESARCRLRENAEREESERSLTEPSYSSCQAPDPDAKAMATATTVVARQALRHILYSSLRDINLRNVLDGCLLPPPLRHPDLNDPDGARPYTRAEVVEAARKIPRELVPMLVSVPLNFALTTGVYDARLRATMKRLAHLLEYPIEGIYAKEEMLANVDVTELAEIEAAGMRAAVVSSNYGVTVKRVALIGAITIIGATALFISGGIAAPIVAPAFTTLINAIAASIGAAGALGTMLLSGTALVGIFTTLIEIASHTAAFAIIVAPYLSAAKITAIFGIAGAGLSAYKANKRFGGLEDFSIRSVDEVERLPEMEMGKEDVRDSRLEDIVAASKKLHEHEEKSVEDDVTTSSMKGYVVPTNVRTLAMMNMANAPRYANRRCISTCAVENRLHKSVELSLAAIKLTLGIWAHLPPQRIPSEHVGVFLSHNRPNYPTGTHGYICYKISCVDKVGLTPAMRDLLGVSIWISVGVSFGLTVTLGCVIKLPADCPLNENRKKKEKNPGEYLRRMLFELDVDAHAAKDFVQRLGPLEVEGRLKPKPHVIIRMLPEEGTDTNGRTLLSYFHEKELGQQLSDTKELVDPKTHRAVFAVIKNSMSTPIEQPEGFSSALQCLGVKAVSGAPLAGFVLPKTLPVRHACIVPYTHPRKSMLTGTAEIEIILMGETRALSIPDRPPAPHTVIEGSPFESAATASSSSSAPSVPKLPPNYFINLRAKVSPTSGLSGTAAALTTMRPANEGPTSPSTADPKKEKDSNRLRHKEHECSRESPFARIKVSFDEDNYAVIFEILDPLPPNMQAQEEGSVLQALKSVLSKRSMTITIAATGYTSVFDPRIPAEHQQVVVWQKPLSESELFSRSEQFVLQWEDEQQSFFFGVVGLSAEKSSAQYATESTKASIIKETKSRLMHTALFAFLSSYRTLISVFDFPMYVVWASDAIDNSFATLRNRSKLAGRELASALLSPERGNRPVTLTGFSFGANVIFECLLVLFEANALAVVEDVYLLGACLETDRDKWRKARQAVGGRLVNVYNRGDLTLRIYHRSNSIGHRPPAGLCQVALPGIENVDVSAELSTHGGYATNLTRILAHIPPLPTPETCRVCTSGSALGACVPASEILDAADNVIEAMHSRLCLDDGYILSYTNRMVADGPGSTHMLGGKDNKKTKASFGAESHTGDVSFVFIGEVCFGCQFDFSPPPSVDTGDAGVSGILCPHRSVSPCCVAGFAAHMTALSDTILVVLAFTAFDEKKKEVFGSCKALVVPEYGSPDETPIELGNRLKRLVESYAPSAEAVRATAASETFTSIVDIPVMDLRLLRTSSCSSFAASVPTSPSTANNVTASFGSGAGVRSPSPTPSITNSMTSALSITAKPLLNCPIKIAWTYKGTHFTWAASGILTRDPSLMEVMPDYSEEDDSRELDPLYRAFLGMEAPPIGRYLDADVMGSGAEVLPLAGMHKGVVELRKALCTPPSNLTEESAEVTKHELAAACGRSRGFSVEGMPLKPIIKNLGSSLDASSGPLGGRSRLASSHTYRGRLGRSCPTGESSPLLDDAEGSTNNRMGRSLLGSSLDVLGMTQNERFEATLAAVQRRTVVVVQPIVIANCSVKKVPLCLPLDTQSLMAAAEGLQWLRMPPPLIGAGQCTMLAFRWRVDPYSVFKAEVDRVMRRSVAPGSQARKAPTSCSVLLSTFSLGELVGKSPEPVGRSTYIIRIIATLTCEDFIAHPLVTTNISVSCLADTSDDKHRQSVTCFASPLPASPKDGLEEMQYHCISIPAGGAAATSAEAHNDLTWRFYKQ